MPCLLESGKLQLTPDEVIAYRPAADRLHEACEISVDLAKPISLDDWILLRVGQAALAGETRLLDDVIEVVERAVRSRRQPS